MKFETETVLFIKIMIPTLIKFSLYNLHITAPPQFQFYLEHVSCPILETFFTQISQIIFAV